MVKERERARDRDVGQDRRMAAQTQANTRDVTTRVYQWGRQIEQNERRRGEE